MIMSLFRRSPKNINRQIVDSLYRRIVAAAREPVLYGDWGVPDSPLGRYESLGLHMILFLHRTKTAEQAAGEMSQDVLDEFFMDLDHSIRELGVGDPSVPKRMKRLSRMFYGRMSHYWTALDAGDSEALAAAVARNMSPDAPSSIDGAAIAGYMVTSKDMLARFSDEDLLAGRLAFPIPVAHGEV
jgi:cytochrome b pre-mRNA-processing protein 3